MKYKYTWVINFPNGEQESGLDNDESAYDTAEDANAAAEEWLGNYLAGMEDLNLSNPGDYPLDDELPTIGIVTLSKDDYGYNS